MPTGIRVISQRRYSTHVCVETCGILNIFVYKSNSNILTEGIWFRRSKATNRCQATSPWEYALLKYSIFVFVHSPYSYRISAQRRSFVLLPTIAVANYMTSAEANRGDLGGCVLQPTGSIPSGQWIPALQSILVPP